MRVLVVDALALVLYIVVSLPAMTGVGAHEWLGLGIGLVLLVHGAQHVDFAGHLLTSRGAWRAKGRILLDAALVLSVAVVVLSGLMESGTVLPPLAFMPRAVTFGGRCMLLPPRCSRASCCAWGAQSRLRVASGQRAVRRKMNELSAAI